MIDHLNKKLVGIGIAIGVVIIFVVAYQLISASIISPDNNATLPSVQPSPSTGKHITIELNESMGLKSG